LLVWVRFLSIRTYGPYTFLSDVRQIGPNRERDISGVCSACGATLLARLDSAEKPTPTLLQTKLEKVFQRHVDEQHSTSHELKNSSKESHVACQP